MWHGPAFAAAAADAVVLAGCGGGGDSSHGTGADESPSRAAEKGRRLRLIPTVESAAPWGIAMNDESPAPAAVGSSNGGYLLTGQPTELERLQLQSPGVGSRPGESCSRQLGEGRGRRALDVGVCGGGCWAGFGSSPNGLGPTGEVVGTDIDSRHARRGADVR